MNDRNHFDYECGICDETWPDEEARTEHEVDCHHYCGDCDRTFQSANNIQMVRGQPLNCRLARDLWLTQNR